MDNIDAEIRGLVSAGDARAAATLIIRELGPEVLGFLLGALGDAAAADDVFAEVSQRLWRSIGTFRWQCSVRTWLYVIARNEQARFLKGAQRQAGRRVSASELDGLIAAVRTATHSALRSEKAGKLTALRDELSIEDRSILILRVDRDLQWDEVARVFLESDGPIDAQELKREAARIRKRFQLIKHDLRERVAAGSR